MPFKESREGRYALKKEKKIYLAIVMTIELSIGFPCRYDSSSLKNPKNNFQLFPIEQL